MAAIITRAGKGSPLTNAEVDANFTGLNAEVSTLARAIAVQMTAAASGSRGIQVLNNPTWAIGADDFTIQHKTRPLGFATSSGARHSTINNAAGLSSASPIIHFDLSGGLVTPKLFINAVEYNLSQTIPVAEYLVTKEWAFSVVRQSPSAAGSVTFYRDGIQFGSAASITAGTPHTFTGSNLIIEGQSTVREPVDWYYTRLFNRALTSAEVLDLSINGVALADRGASQTQILQGNNSTFDGAGNWSTAAATGTVAYDSGDAGHETTFRVQRTGTSGRGQINLATVSGLPIAGRSVTIQFDIKAVTPGTVQVLVYTDPSFPVGGQHAVFNLTAGSWVEDQVRTFIAVSDVLYFVVNTSGGEILLDNVTAMRIGLTSELLASNAQSNTGQILDSSGNRNHALLPASGATVVGRPVSQTREVRWTNTWAGTNELQYIGGVNQAILPANAYIESIIGTVSGATPHDIIVGDGSDTDRYVTITTGLAAGTTSFALANRTTDGTNLKLTVDVDTNATMSIAWVISYRTLEG